MIVYNKEDKEIKIPNGIGNLNLVVNQEGDLSNYATTQYVDEEILKVNSEIEGIGEDIDVIDGTLIDIEERITSIEENGGTGGDKKVYDVYEQEGNPFIDTPIYQNIYNDFLEKEVYIHIIDTNRYSKVIAGEKYDMFGDGSVYGYKLTLVDTNHKIYFYDNQGNNEIAWVVSPLTFNFADSVTFTDVNNLINERDADYIYYLDTQNIKYVQADYILWQKTDILRQILVTNEIPTIHIITVPSENNGDDWYNREIFTVYGSQITDKSITMKAKGVENEMTISCSHNNGSNLSDFSIVIEPIK